MKKLALLITVVIFTFGKSMAQDISTKMAQEISTKIDSIVFVVENRAKIKKDLGVYLAMDYDDVLRMRDRVSKFTLKKGTIVRFKKRGDEYKLYLGTLYERNYDMEISYTDSPYGDIDIDILVYDAGGEDFWFSYSFYKDGNNEFNVY